MSDVLERNVARLLSHAYVPVEVPDGARERLRQSFLAAVERRVAAGHTPSGSAPDAAGAPPPVAPQVPAHAPARVPDPSRVPGPGRRPRPTPPARRRSGRPTEPPTRIRRGPIVLAAALVLLLSGVALWRTGAFDPGTTDLPVAGVDSTRWRALDPDGDPSTADWTPLSTPRLPWDGVAPLELASADAPADLVLAHAPDAVPDAGPDEVLVARLARRSSGGFGPAGPGSPAPRVARLLGGHLDLHAGEAGWLLGDAEGGLWLGAGELRVGPREARGLRLELRRGRAFTQGFEALPVGEVVHLADGRLVRDRDARGTGASVDPGGSGEPGTRSDAGGADGDADDPAGAPDPTADPAAGPRASLALEWRGSTDGDLRLWLRREVALPEISEAHARDLPAAGGTVDGLEPGSYTLVLEPAEGAAVLREGVVLRAEEPTRIVLAPVAAGSIRGHVLDGRTGAPLRGARVLVQEELPHRVLHAQGEDLLEPPRTSTVTDDLGAFRLDPVSVGVRNLVVVHPELAPGFSAELRVRAGEETDAGNIELRVGGTVHGRVQHGPGSPSIGTEVIASRVPMDRVQRVMCYGGALTDDRGEYRIEGLAPGSYVVLDLAPDAVGGPAGSLRQIQLADGEVRRVDFGGATEGSLHGVLVDADGAPLPDHHVTLTADGGGPYRSVGTDAAGRFVFEEVPAGRHHLYVTWEGQFGSLVHLRQVEVGDTQREPLRLVFPATTLTFDLAAPDGQAVDDGLLLLERWFEEPGEWRFLARVEHGRDGRFEVRGVPPGRVRGTFTTPEASTGGLLLEAFEIEGPGPHRHVHELAPAGGMLVEVRDAEGRARSGHEVQLAREDGQVLLVPNLRTDAAGQVALPCLPPGPWQVRVRDGERWRYGQGVVTPGDTVLVRVPLP